MKANDSLKSDYDRQGYVIVPGVISISSIHSLLTAVARTFRKYRPEGLPEGSEPWNAEAFHQNMIRFRKDSPEWFGALYDTIQTSSALFRLIHDDAVQDVASRLLAQDPEDLCATGHMVRMDPPEDKRNVLAWHQESFYYNQNLAGGNGLVVWIPLRDVSAQDGPIWICPTSHRSGQLATRSLGRKDAISSEQFVIAPEEIEKYTPTQITAKAGDAVFFHMDLLHRSGENAGRQIRFTAGVRFHCMLKDDFLPGRLLYKSNEMVEKHRAEKYKKEGALV